MPKLSKRMRERKKEKEERRVLANKKAGNPYSHHKIRTCHHYITYGGGFVLGIARGLLMPISEKECICSNCQKQFSIKAYHVMNDWTQRYTGKDYCHAQEVQEISGQIPPVKYYFTGPNKIVYVDDEVL